MRTFACWLLVLFVTLTAGCRTLSLNGSSSSIKGSGKIKSETRKVAGFTGILLEGSGRVLIEQTGTDSLTITADDNLLPSLTSDVKGAQLVLSTKNHTSISPTSEIVYKLTVKHLNIIEVSGAGNVEAKGINTDSLNTSVSGSGNLTMAGKVKRQEITLSGSGSFQGENLKSNTVTIAIAGSGNAVLAASEKLDVSITGSGSVEYIGSPVVTQNTVGSGTVKKR